MSYHVSVCILFQLGYLCPNLTYSGSIKAMGITSFMLDFCITPFMYNLTVMVFFLSNIQLVLSVPPFSLSLSLSLSFL